MSGFLFQMYKDYNFFIAIHILSWQWKIKIGAIREYNINRNNYSLQIIIWFVVSNGGQGQIYYVILHQAREASDLGRSPMYVFLLAIKINYITTWLLTT